MTPMQATTKYRALTYEGTATGFVTDAQIYADLWQGECELNSLLELYQAATALTTTTGTQEYSFPTDYIVIKRVTYDGDRLKAADFRELDSIDDKFTDSDSQTGDPTHYYLWAGKIGMWPVPDTSATVEIWGVKQPASITTNTAAFSIPLQFTDFPLDYALMNYYMKDQDDGRFQVYQARWENDKQMAQRLWNRRRYADRLLTVKMEDQSAYTVLGMK